MKEFFNNSIPVGEYWLVHLLNLNHPSFELYFKTEQRLSESDFELVKKEFSSKDEITILKYMEIKPSFRKKGLGRKLLNQIKKESNPTILLISEKVDEFLLDFYLKEGFEEIKTDNHLPILVFRG